MSNKTIRSFHIVDSVFNLKKERLRKVTQLISEANHNNTELRTVEIMAESVDQETVQLLKKAHVVSIETGPQTVNRETLDTISRYFDRDKFERGIRLLLDEDIEVLTDLIIGLPGDNLFRFATSIKTMINLKPSTIVFSILHVLPGTELYTESNTIGLEFDEKAPHLVLKNQTFSYIEIDKAVIMSVSIGKEYNLQLAGRYQGDSPQVPS
jgi:coproporphyrinogen III oxidase-like Fe-S oxidoreductase